MSVKIHDSLCIIIHHTISPKSNHTSDDMRFIGIKVINCIDPQNCLINYLQPVLLERPGDAKHKNNSIWPKWWKWKHNLGKWDFGISKQYIAIYFLIILPHALNFDLRQHWSMSSMYDVKSGKFPIKWESSVAVFLPPLVLYLMAKSTIFL